MKSSEQCCLKAHAASNISLRKNNGDAYLVNEKMGLFIVADGMGGHDKVELAVDHGVRENSRICDCGPGFDPVFWRFTI